MFMRRVIPCLTLLEGGLVRTVKFKNPSYVGDPINAVRIFNDKEVDELMLLNIDPKASWQVAATQAAEIAAEAFVPMAYGGQIRKMDQIHQVFKMGYEKVVLNTAVLENPTLIRDAVEHYGSQSVVASMDVKKRLLGKMETATQSGRRATGLSPIQHAEKAMALGVGELMVTAVDRDGQMEGYDLPLIQSITDAVDVPVIAMGGAGNLEHLRDVLVESGASAAAAGSMFVYQGPRRAVLVQYPKRSDLNPFCQ